MSAASALNFFHSADEEATWEITGDASYAAETDKTPADFLAEALAELESEAAESGA